MCKLSLVLISVLRCVYLLKSIEIDVKSLIDNVIPLFLYLNFSINIFQIRNLNGFSDKIDMIMTFFLDFLYIIVPLFRIKRTVFI
ncbi:LOW QUALITY PROTEIN: hypothetical protein T552_04051 [Pneumocystis carinii B80]|uniref:Uncharacterized protein n=1 Tax=Pneumocystis carinii (strain B80) TaxID=1408658 RepID=A0A0W4ZST1_PNEC8|nr:LOW QUALITY PROTEIN: hypothetical protein T552_04051 [Pneumocystis carinii B80]KTW31434.1 LOW QUALITY PROTEIN: hypothetical protein T552_04051 [Pneumocystis carinii B80]